MLLRDLLKHTWNEHPDKADLQKSLAIIRQSIMLVNESKRQDSTKKKVARFNERFKNPGELEKILGQGNFITESAVRSYDEQGRLTKAYLVLFDDQLVFAKRFTDMKKEGKLNYKKTFRFADARSLYLNLIPAPVESFDEQLGKNVLLILLRVIFPCSPPTTMTCRQGQEGRKGVWLQVCVRGKALSLHGRQQHREGQVGPRSERGEEEAGP